MRGSTARRPGEVVFTVLMLVASLYLFRHAYGISGFSALSSPGAFPMAATGAMVVAALCVLARTLSMPAAERGLAPLRARILPNIVAAFALLIVVYGALLETLGFVLASLGFLFAAMWLLHRRGPGVALGWAVLSIALVYIVFRLVFQVILPEGVLPERRILAAIGDMIAASRR